MEIKNTDLRIGNCIQKLVIDEWVYDTVQARDMLLIYNHPELVKGIPLTEELLLKMGFTLKADNAPEGFTNYATADVFYIHMGGSKCGPLAERGEFVWGDNYKTIETVHQLQNLYHALTGQELTLS